MTSRTRERDNHIIKNLEPNVTLNRNGLKQMKAVEQWGKKEGLTAAQTSAILGSMQQESSGLTSGTNHNWLGWSNPAGTDADHSHDTKDVGAYLTNFVKHLGSPSAPAAYNTFKRDYKNATPEQCSNYWGHKMEVCGIMGARNEYSKQYYRQITKNDPASVYGASSYAKSKPKKSLYIDKAHVVKSKNGTYQVKVTPKYRRDVTTNGKNRGNYLINSKEESASHSQTISLNDFNKIMKANHMPGISKSTAKKVHSSGRQLVNAKDGLTFKATVYGKDRNFDTSTVRRSHKAFNYVSQLDANQKMSLLKQYAKKATKLDAAIQNQNNNQNGQPTNASTQQQQPTQAVTPTNKQLNEFATSRNFKVKNTAGTIGTRHASITTGNKPITRKASIGTAHINRNSGSALSRVAKPISHTTHAATRTVHAATRVHTTSHHSGRGGLSF